MEFVVRRRSRPVVPIISLIDILAILLIFFVATSTFRKKKAAMSVNLPRAGVLASPLAEGKRVSLIMRSADEMVLGERAVTLDTLGAVLAEFRASAPDLRLELQADEGLPVGTLVAVWDALTTEGFSIKEIPTRLEVSDRDKSAKP